MTDETIPAPLEAPLPLVIPLPDYHGRAPSGMKTSLNGAGNRLSTPHEIGATVVLLIEAKVKGAGHDQTDDGLLYVEKLKVSDLFEVPGDPGRRLLSSYRNAYRVADDAVKGRKALEGDDVDLGVAGMTDGSGVALTPEELAELRGDPVRAALDERLTPAVVLFSDGSRDLWPDEFDQGDPRPHAGDRFEADGDDGPVSWIHVVEVLHAETGERLEVWTDEDENARLLELERRAMAEEAGEVDADVILDDEAELSSVAFSRLEFSDGAVEEVDAADEIPADSIARATRIVEVSLDGTERIVKDRIPVDEVPFAPSSFVDGSVPLPGEEGFEEGLEPLEPDVTFVEDQDGYADVVAVDFPVEPNPEDFAFVDREIGDVKTFLVDVTDLVEAKRILEAEKRGRGRGLKTRKGAVDAILRRIAELEK